MTRSALYFQFLMVTLLLLAGAWESARNRWQLNLISLTLAVCSGPLSYLAAAASPSRDLGPLPSLFYVLASVGAVVFGIRAFAHERTFSASVILIASLLNAAAILITVIWLFAFAMALGGH